MSQYVWLFASIAVVAGAPAGANADVLEPRVGISYPKQPAPDRRSDGCQATRSSRPSGARIVGGTVVGGALGGAAAGGLVYAAMGAPSDADLTAAGFVVLGSALGYLGGSTYGARWGARVDGERPPAGPIAWASAAGLGLGGALMSKGLSPAGAVIVHTALTSAVAYNGARKLAKGVVVSSGTACGIVFSG